MGGFDAMRKKRMCAIEEYVKTKQSVPYLELVGWVCLSFGLTEKRAREYIRLLTLGGKLYVSDGKVKSGAFTPSLLGGEYG